MANAAQAAWLAQQSGAVEGLHGGLHGSVYDTGSVAGDMSGQPATLAYAATGSHIGATGATLGSATADLRAASFVYFAPVAAATAPVAPRWREMAYEMTSAPVEQPQQATCLPERSEERSVTTTLIRATALVAQVLGRVPEDVWAEALENWLASQEQSQQGREGEPFGQNGGTPRARLVEVRRQETWQTIDETLHALRVS